MKKERIIVFGLGKTLENNIERIKRSYEIIGYSSNRIEERDIYYPYFIPEELNKVVCDKILICSVYEVNILNQLIDIGIDVNKIELYYCDFNKTLSHAQYGEDILLLWMLKVLDIEIKTIRYIELGTSHPIHLNNTFSLYKQGARGILVEPCKSMHNIIKKYRPEDTLLDIAVGLNDGIIEYNELSSQVYGTIVYDLLDESYCSDNKDFEIKNKYIVQMKTINQILEMSNKVDILSIDIEGLDFEVLNSMDWEKYHPLIIIAELIAEGAKHQKDKEIISLMQRKGYMLLYDNYVNGVFIHNSIERQFETFF